jgi:hypothetical protein
MKDKIYKETIVSSNKSITLPFFYFYVTRKHLFCSFYHLILFKKDFIPFTSIIRSTIFILLAVKRKKKHDANSILYQTRPLLHV